MKYTLILPALAYTHASAWAAPGNQSECVKRCNDLPFKVAASARRAGCIEGCGSGPAVSRDPSCVDKCNSKRTRRRKRVACIEHCPVSADTKTYEITLHKLTSNRSEADFQTMDLSAYSKNDTISIVNFDAVSYVPLEDLAFKTASRNGTGTDAERIVTKCTGSLSNSSHDIIEYWQNETSSSNSSTSKNNDVIIDNKDNATTSDLFNISKETIEAVFKRSFDLAFDENKTSSLNDELNAQGNDDVIGTPSKAIEVPHASMVPTNSESTPSIGTIASHQNKSSSLDIGSHDDDLSKRHRECVNSCTNKRTLQRKRDACLKRCLVLENQKDMKSILNDSSSPVSMLTRARDSVRFEL